MPPLNKFLLLGKSLCVEVNLVVGHSERDGQKLTRKRNQIEGNASKERNEETQKLQSPKYLHL